mmetsp:Transcript_5396/g.9063  ORF Transcript_5396/g.9063 Transcript_5396/m.9063 type:complete len:166 (-) Transcript_5396:265-762(-)|eukprot:CAMPEP_0168609272 /NCGR_PEP_ID=MMETSP0449_2-20121227/1109_1 /TAXON_ID=1082188 /ORGANISM="Strombidium rassoulzadegani, Strain ras09" /LENGTH=165 /DNA_ID=CAMNT_0008649387 /DNA_START=569 /DNA_END=1066 /DNA_ORIENTATION=-
MPSYVDILFWFNKASGISFGSGSNDSYTFDQFIPAIYDTGTVIVGIPKSIAVDFFGRILKGHRFIENEGQYLISCANKDKFDPVKILIEGFWFEISPQDYVIEKEGACLLGLTALKEDYFLFGTIFMQGYYMVHDMDNNRVGIAPSLNSHKQPIQQGENPSKYFS